MSLQIKIPAFWKSILEYLAKEDIKPLCIETAHLDVKADKSLAALAVDYYGDIGLICPDVSSVRWNIEAWDIKTLKHRAMGDIHRYYDQRSGETLWIAPSVEKLRTKDVGIVFVIDSHLLPEQCLLNTFMIFVGKFCNKGHWFYELARKSNSDKLTAEQILEVYPEQKEDLLEETDLNYRRYMNVEDISPVVLPLMILAKERFKIRTDKGINYLSKSQQEEALYQRSDNSGAAAIVSLEFSPVQRRYLALKRLAKRQGKKRVILLKYRRGGFTTLEQAESYALVAETPNSFVATLADVKDKSQRIFRIAKLLHERDPKAPIAVGDSKTQLELSNGSLFFIGTAGSRAFGRGDTLQKAHLSEAAYFGRSKESKIEDVGLFIAGVTEAASNGEVVAESTPNGREWFCETYESAKRNENEWFPIFLPWFIDSSNRLQEGTYNPEEILETLTEEEKRLIQIAKDEWKVKLSLAMIAFRRKKKQDLKHLALQEYPENDIECFLTSGICFFDVQFLMKLLDSALEHPRIHIPGGYEIRWKEPIQGRDYVAGCDTSEGLPGCDRSGVGILDRETGEQVAAIHGLFRPDVLAEHAARICTEYNKALLGVERENHGHAVLQKLKDIGYGEPHYRGGPLFYFETEQRQSSHPGREKSSGRAGWSTNERTRPIMLDALEEAIRSGALKINDRDFISECLTFKLQDSGKFEADRGAYDDTVFKYGIAWQMRLMPRRSSGFIELGDVSF